MTDEAICTCGKKIEYKDSYRCRICYQYYCSDCSLDHFGLYETKDQVQYKNIFRTMFWLFRKRIFGR